MAIYELHEFDKDKVFTGEIKPSKVAHIKYNPYEKNSVGQTVIDANKDLSHSRNFINLNTTKVSQDKFNRVIDIEIKEFLPANLDNIINDLSDKIAALEAAKAELQATNTVDSEKIDRLLKHIDTLEGHINMSSIQADPTVVDYVNKLVHSIKVGKRFDLYSSYDTAPSDDFQNTNKLLSENRKAIGVLETDGYFRIYVGKFDIYGKPIPGAKIKKIYEIGSVQGIEESSAKHGAPLYFGMRVNPGKLPEGFTPETNYYHLNTDVANDKLYGKTGTKSGKDHWQEFGRAEYEQGLRSHPWIQDDDGQLEIYAVYANKWVPQSIIDARPQAENWATGMIKRVNDTLKKSIADDYAATTADANSTHDEVVGHHRIVNWGGTHTVDDWGPVANFTPAQKAAKWKEYEVRKLANIKNFRNSIDRTIDFLETHYAMKFTANNKPGDVSQNLARGKAWSDPEIDKINSATKIAIENAFNDAVTEVGKTKKVIIRTRTIYDWNGAHRVDDTADVPLYTSAQIAAFWNTFDQFKANKIATFVLEATKISNTLKTTYSVDISIPDLTKIQSGYYNDPAYRNEFPKIENLVIENADVYEKNGVLYGSWNPRLPLVNYDSDKIMQNWDVVYGTGENKVGWSAEAKIDDDGIFALMSSEGSEIWSTRL
jgi:hypothetical protein